MSNYTHIKKRLSAQIYIDVFCRPLVKTPYDPSPDHEQRDVFNLRFFPILYWKLVFSFKNLNIPVFELTLILSQES